MQNWFQNALFLNHRDPSQGPIMRELRGAFQGVPHTVSLTGSLGRSLRGFLRGILARALLRFYRGILQMIRGVGPTAPPGSSRGGISGCALPVTLRGSLTRLLGVGPSARPSRGPLVGPLTGTLTRPRAELCCPASSSHPRKPRGRGPGHVKAKGRGGLTPPPTARAAHVVTGRGRGTEAEEGAGG